MTTGRGRRPLPAPLDGLLRPASERRPAFVEGLILGAMVGAAIAGSTLWTRFREARRARLGEADPRVRSDGPLG